VRRSEPQHRPRRIYGPSLAWSALFFSLLFGSGFLFTYLYLADELNLGGYCFLFSCVFLGAFAFVYGVARFYVISDRGIRVKVLGVWEIASAPWEKLEGTRGTIMRGRYSGATNASARVTRVYRTDGRVAFTFNFFTGNFGALHQEIFLHIRDAKKRMEGEA
jgi:hypothetical protein